MPLTRAFRNFPGDKTRNDFSKQETIFFLELDFGIIQFICTDGTYIFFLVLKVTFFYSRPTLL